MKQIVVARILVAALLIESFITTGIIGYHIGSKKEIPQPIYNITLKVDPSMIEYLNPPTDNQEPESNAEPESDKNIVINAEHRFTDEEIDYLAKTVWGEARGLDDTEKAAVVWTVLNRYDNGNYGETVIDVITAPNQFVGYRAKNPVDSDIRNLVVDVLDRYALEKAGATDVGRVLPASYLYFRARDGHNIFTEVWNSNDIWDWSLESPYV